MSKERDQMLRWKTIVGGLLVEIDQALGDSVEAESEPSKERGPIEPVDTKGKPNLGKIRTMMKLGFTESELKSIGKYEPEFREVKDELADLSNKNKVIDELITFAEARVKIPHLLGWCKANNPTRYEQCGPYTY